MIHAGVGFSEKTNPSEAITEAFEKAISTLGGNSPSFIMLFVSPTAYNQEELLKELKTKSPNSVVIGCSTAGEITSTGGSLDNSLALMTIYSDTMKFVPGVGKDIKTDPRKAGQEIANNLLSSQNAKPKAMIILPDGLAGNGADIVRGILDVFGKDFMVVGGSAGDDYQFKQTFQYFNNEVLTGSVVGIGLYGDFHFGVGVRHGWIPIGNPRTATKSQGNILYELDNKPAIQIFEDYFGKDKNPIDKNEPLAKMAITYPLGIIAPNKDGYLIRDPITADDKGAITLAAEIPEGSEVSIMIGSKEEAIEAAEDAAKKALEQVQGKSIKSVFLFNCIARKKLLMTKKQEEIDKIMGVFPNIPLVGFYTYGEQAPLGGEVITCSFHNETDVIFALAE